MATLSSFIGSSSVAYLPYLKQKNIFCRIQDDAKKKKRSTPSFLHSSRGTHTRYMEAIADLKNIAKPLACTITFKGTTKLPEEHPFKAAKYIVQYTKKGSPHVQVVINEEGTHPNNLK
jgi:hypothetical protein